MVPVLAAMCVFGSVALFGLWYTRSKNIMEDRVRALSAHRRAMVEQEDPFTQRVMFPAVARAHAWFVDLLPTSLIARARKWLMISDSEMSLGTFMSIVLVTTTALPAIYLRPGARGDGLARARGSGWCLCSRSIGFLAPDDAAAAARRRTGRRRSGRRCRTAWTC